MDIKDDEKYRIISIVDLEMSAFVLFWLFLYVSGT